MCKNIVLRFHPSSGILFIKLVEYKLSNQKLAKCTFETLAYLVPLLRKVESVGISFYNKSFTKDDIAVALPQIFPADPLKQRDIETIHAFPPIIYRAINNIKHNSEYISIDMNKSGYLICKSYSDEYTRIVSKDLNITLGSKLDSILLNIILEYAEL